MSEETINTESVETEAQTAPVETQTSEPETAAETAPLSEAVEPVSEAALEPAETAEGDAASAAEGATSGGEQRGRQHRKEYAVKGDMPPRISRFKKKVCRFCSDKNLPLDYKRADILEGLITDRGKILPRRITGTCAKHQRAVAREIKRARIIALLPFVEK